MLTSNNMPGLMIDAWGLSNGSVVFLIAAVVVAYFYIANLVLAVVYDGYLENKREVGKGWIERSCVCLWEE